jgi:Zn-dependent metalloprotease
MVRTARFLLIPGIVIGVVAAAPSSVNGAADAPAKLSSLASQDFQPASWKSTVAAALSLDAIEVDETGNTWSRSFYLRGNLSGPNNDAHGAADAVTADANVDTVLRKLAPLLGIDRLDGEIARRRSTHDAKGRRHDMYQIGLDGIPVRAAEFAVHVSADGVVYAVGGSVAIRAPEWPSVVRDRLTKASVTAEQARATAETDARRHSGADQLVSVTARKLLVTDEPYVIWEVDVILGNGYGRRVYDIDAATGAIVRAKSEVQAAGAPATPASGEIHQIAETVTPRPSDTPGDLEPASANLKSLNLSAIPRGMSASVEASATQTVMTETFESTFPSAAWRVFDDNGATSGEVYWDDTNYRASQGSWSAWCADGGANRGSPGTPYPANMNTWMIWGPFSLTGATGGTFTLAYWLKSEQSYDYLKYLVSTNGSNFYGYQTSGDSGGWKTGTVDFTNVPTLGNISGAANVWIAVQFTSDGSLGYEGGYIDNVSVVKQIVSPADLSLQSVHAASGSYPPGATVTVNNSTTNIGGESSTSYRITFYASVNTTITTSDTELGYVDRAPLAAGANHSFGSQVPLPATLAAGAYYIGAILTVTDANSSNNTNHDPTAITVTELAGPKIGTGFGVLGNAQSHIDSYFDTTLIDEYLLRDVTRRQNTNVHGHNGRMGSSSVIETKIMTVYVVVDADDLDNAWSSTSTASAVDQHVYTGKVYDYLNRQLLLNGFNGGGASMNSVVDIDSLERQQCADYWILNSTNAYWDGAAVNVCNGYPLPYSGALDVVAHEWGHAVTELAPTARTGRLAYENESGALNEAFSDWFGTATEHWYGETNWTIGEGIDIARSLSNPPSYEQPDIYKTGPDWYSLTSCTPSSGNDWCGVHTNSGVGNKMFYLLSAGSGAETGGVFNSVRVTGLGIQTAMAIALDANLHHWPAKATYPMGREGMIDAAQSVSQNAVAQVMNAWAAVGVGSPACTSFTISPGAVSPSSLTGSRVVTITGVPSGCQGGSWSASTQNTSSTARSSTATVASRTFTVDQAGFAPLTCTSFSIAPTSSTPTSVNGSTTITVIGSPSGCQGGTWTAAANATWLSVNPAIGVGSGSVTVSWGQNTASTSRVATVTIFSNTFTVTQAGASPATCSTFSVAPTASSPSASAGSATVSITGSPSGCQGGSWSASGNGSWLSATPTSGSGSGSVVVAWSQNSSISSRSSNTMIAGNNFPVTQAGASPSACTSFTISPGAVSPSSLTGSRVVTITGVPSGCQGGSWSASGNGTWLTVSPTSGSGPGSVTVAWTQNTSSTARSSTATVASNLFAVTQAASPFGVVVFSDDPIVPGITRIKVIHVVELRTAINSLRSVAGLSPFPFSRTIQAGVTIQVADVQELRTAIDAARSALGLPPVNYANGASRRAVLAIDVMELRNGLR